MENNKTIKASELKKGDKCIIKDKIYIITAIWIVPTLTEDSLIHKLRFVLYCDDDKCRVEIIYLHNALLINENGFVKFD